MEIARLQEPASPVAAKPDYSSYVDYLEARGWSREQLTLDENNTNLVTLFALAAATTGTVIDIRCPAGQKMSLMGTQQVVRGADARTAHALRLRLANTVDTEIDLNTKVRVTKEKTSEAIVQLARVFYADINLTKNQGSTPGNTGTTFKTDAFGVNQIKFILVSASNIASGCRRAQRAHLSASADQVLAAQTAPTKSAA